LDGFKKVNDTLGHAAGDEVLIETAKRLHKAVGQSDLVARLGGDEFAIIFNGYGSNAAVIKVLDKIIQAMGRPFNTNPHEAFLGVSIGVSNYPEHGEDYATLLKKADTAMYYVKQNGKNSYKIYEEEKEDSNLTLKTGVYKGIQEGQFFLDFQPQFDMQGTIIGAEALMRWDSPEFGTISPEIFIPIVEEAGLMTYLGTWAMRYACHQMGEFRKVKPDFVLSVNVSPIQFEGDALDEFVLSALAEGNIPSESIVLEVPEAVLVASKDKIEQRMSVLCKRGVRFSIDDFGLGMSSLTQLTKLPVHTLKIGKAFLKAIESEASPKFEVEKRFIAALVKLAHSVDLKCVAEGVETKTQLEFLSVCGCDYVQGYLLGKPISGDALVKLLKENR
jgi:diguanylate cyclase (GGDEF)-like protein